MKKRTKKEESISRQKNNLQQTILDLILILNEIKNISI